MDPTDASQFLSSGASSSRRPMEYRIYHTKLGVRFYLEKLHRIQPEGAQFVPAIEIQREGRDSVCLPTLSGKSDTEVLTFWKRTRDRFKYQLLQIERERYGTPPVTPTRSELRADHRMEVAWAERFQGLQRQVEEWLSRVPCKLCTPPASSSLTSSSKESASPSTQHVGFSAP